MSIGFNTDYDFDFESDVSNKFVPFIIGFLMYSVTIAIMSVFFTYSLTSGWKDTLSGRITIEFQSNVDGADSNLTDKQNDEVMKVLKSTDGVQSVKKLQETDILKILEPWLSGTAIPDDFPFPTIYDVETDKGMNIDLLSLNNKLSKISTGAKIHDHATWYAPILKISNGLFGFAIILSILIFATVTATVIFITRKTLGTHHSTVKILQLIGATNTYIASQFRQYYCAVSCKSSLISIVCSFLTIFGIVLLSSASVLHILRYGVIAIIVPIITVILIMVTSKNTVLFFLKSDNWIN